MGKNILILENFILFFLVLSMYQTSLLASDIQISYMQQLKAHDKAIHSLAWYQDQQKDSSFLLASAAPENITISIFNPAKKIFTKKLTKNLQASSLSWYPKLPILTVATKNKIELWAYNFKENKLSLLHEFEPNIGTIETIIWHPTLRLNSCQVLACSTHQENNHHIYLYKYDLEKKSFTLLQKIQESSVQTTPLISWNTKLPIITYSCILGFIQNSIYSNPTNKFEPVSKTHTGLMLFKKMAWHPTLPIIFGSQAFLNSNSDAKNNGISLWSYDYSSNSFSHLQTIDLLDKEYLSEKHNLKYDDGYLDLCAPRAAIWHPKKSILTFGSKRGVISLWEVAGLEESLKEKDESGFRSAILDATTSQDINIQSTKTASTYSQKN